MKEFVYIAKLEGKFKVNNGVKRQIITIGIEANGIVHVRKQEDWVYPISKVQPEVSQDSEQGKSIKISNLRKRSRF